MDTNRETERLSVQTLNQLPGFQCLRATDALFKLDDPVTQLYNLLNALSILTDQSLQILKILTEISPPIDELKNIVAEVGKTHPYQMDGIMKGEALRNVKLLKINLDKIIKFLQEITASLPPEKMQAPPKDVPIEPVMPTNAMTGNTSYPSQSDEFSSNAGNATPQLTKEVTPPFSQPQMHELSLKLYEIVKPLPSLDLREICLTLRIEYRRLAGASDMERALSLVEDMKHQNRLVDLQRELQCRFPERF